MRLVHRRRSVRISGRDFYQGRRSRRRAILCWHIMAPTPITQIRRRRPSRFRHRTYRGSPSEPVQSSLKRAAKYRPGDSGPVPAAGRCPATTGWHLSYDTEPADNTGCLRT